MSGVTKLFLFAVLIALMVGCKTKNDEKIIATAFDYSPSKTSAPLVSITSKIPTSSLISF